MLHLLKAASFRIHWKLNASLREARRCLELSGANHDVTGYACARLIDANSTNLYGQRGHWVALGVLAKALRKGYADHVWGRSSPASSNPVLMEESELKHEPEKHHFGRETIDYNDAIRSVTLFGDGKPKTYGYHDHKPPVIRKIINYPSAHVKVNGVNLVMRVDTGSTVTTLYVSSAKKLGIEAMDLYRGYAYGITGVGAQPKMGVVKTLEFANVTLNNALVFVSEPGPAAADDGIIGMDILDKMQAMMFYKNHIIDQSRCSAGRRRYIYHVVRFLFGNQRHGRRRIAIQRVSGSHRARYRQRRGDRRSHLGVGQAP